MLPHYIHDGAFKAPGQDFDRNDANFIFPEAYNHLNYYSYHRRILLIAQSPKIIL